MPGIITTGQLLSHSACTINVGTKAPQVIIDLDGLKTQLEQVIELLSATEDKPIGFSWTKNSQGNLSTLTETYPTGKVISEGWDIGRVIVDDQRS